MKIRKPLARLSAAAAGASSHRSAWAAILAASLLLVLALAWLLAAGPAAAASDQPGDGAGGAARPTAWSRDVQPLAAVARHEEPPLDLAAVAAQDEERELLGMAPRFAVPRQTQITPATHGTWEQIGEDTLLWRLRVFSPGAQSLNLGFTRYFMPAGGSLFVHDAAGKLTPLRFGERDNAAHGELWTPVLLADEIVVELTLPLKAREQVLLELTSVNVGYRGFGAPTADKAGACNIDVVCPEGDAWRDEIAAVGVISTGGSTFCTGFMVNNTAEDQRPYFMTANHCGITNLNAASLVVYWNYQSPTCGQQGGGLLNQFQTGAFYRASYSTSDFTLVELDELPDPAWEVAYAGWDRSAANPTSAVAIHHPQTDEKSISFEYDPCTTTSYLGTTSPGNGSHIRVIDWDLGTTEPGSSGSPLFDQNHRVVGQLHGGYAACGNDESDWYGRFSVSWTGGGTNSTRLSNWLDALGTGATAINTLNPHAAGLRVLPGGTFAAAGERGGPFTPGQQDYTLENRSATPLDYNITADVAWLSVSNAAGTIAGGGTITATVSFNAAANALPKGVHTGTVTFVNTTDGTGDTSRQVRLQVGFPELVHRWDLSTNPGWSTQGQWAWGQPTGQGGQYGGPDPTSGYTGPNVYGYNLNGDYANSIPQYHLTSTAIDCSGLSGAQLKFWRWLGVEQPAYDHAYVRVSNDGVNFVTVWENGSQIADNAWTQMVLDISAVADNQPTVYLRWTMGTTDSSWQYCGWNIDDIEIWGLTAAPTDVAGGGVPPRTRLLGNVPNPFNPLTEIRFELAAAGPARLTVHDLRGRLVRTLHDGALPAGPHAVLWDGRDESGRDTGSGTYLCRLEAGQTSEMKKMVLVR